MNTWFKTKAKQTVAQENGSFKRVTSEYLVNALTHGEAEERTFSELSQSARGEFSVIGVQSFPVCDLFDYEEFEDWYSVMVSTQSPDLDSQKVKMIKAKYLVKAKSVANACENLEESLKGTLVDFTILSVTISAISDVFPYVENLDKEISRDSEAYVLAVDGSPAEQGKTYTEGELILESEYNAKVEEN
jgi:hypothetical protein